MSENFFKTHQSHVPAIKATIAAKGAVWFHGDGNIYHAESRMSSADAARYAQRLPGREGRPGPGSYRVQFTSIADVPATVEEINKRLIDSFTKEQVTSVRPVGNKNEVIDVSAFEEPVKEPVKEEKAKAKK